MQWVKSIVYLTFLIILYKISPLHPIDPWGLLIPKKIISLLIALSFIQLSGAVLVRFLGYRLGVIFSGFLGGFVSSTATTAHLARKSRDSSDTQHFETMTYLTATLAMLIECIGLISIGISDYHLEIYLLFLSPVLTTIILIAYNLKKLPSHAGQKTTDFNFAIRPILKLTTFIVLILSLSKVLQNMFGDTGLMLLTFLVSLFEMHSSLIAGIQLHESGALNSSLLLNLLGLIVIASYISKIFLVYSLGSKQLQKTLVGWTLIILTNFIICWFAIHLWISN